MSDSGALKGWQWWLTAVARVVTGATFMVSGCTKMIDLWGFVYKIQDYLEVWHMDVARPLVVTGAGALSLTEFTLGVALLTGCCRRVSVALLTAIMAVMLPLTVYIAVANPVSDCGCFGDWLVISNQATMWKNVVLAGLTGWLWHTNRRMKPLVREPLQWVSISLSVAYMAVVGAIGYNIQPLIDFRAYGTGTSLTADDGEAEDNDDLTFVYEKGGEQREFSADEIPDSTWTFVERRGSGGEYSQSVAVRDSEGDEYGLDEIVDGEGMTMLVLIPDRGATDPSMTFAINELKEAADRAGCTTVGIIGGGDTEGWRDFALADYDVYGADDVDIKTIARGAVAIVMADGGTIVWKRTLSSIDTDRVSEGTDASMLRAGLVPPGPKLFWWLTAMFVALQCCLMTGYNKEKCQICAI